MNKTEEKYMNQKQNSKFKSYHKDQYMSQKQKSQLKSYHKEQQKQKKYNWSLGPPINGFECSPSELGSTGDTGLNIFDCIRSYMREYKFF